MKKIRKNILFFKNFFKKNLVNNKFYKKLSNRIVIVLITTIILINLLILLGVKYAINREISKLKIEQEKVLVSNHTNQIFDNNSINPELMQQIKEQGISRYFLTATTKIDNHFVSTLYLCLFNKGEPIYPRYVYENWSLLNYPNDLMPSIQLVKLILLPEDNNKFHPDKNCFLKEIKTESDWQKVEEKYGFSLSKF